MYFMIPPKAHIDNSTETKILRILLTSLSSELIFGFDLALLFHKFR